MNEMPPSEQIPETRLSIGARFHHARYALADAIDRVIKEYTLPFRPHDARGNVLGKRPKSQEEAQKQMEWARELPPQPREF